MFSWIKTKARAYWSRQMDAATPTTAQEPLEADVDLSPWENDRPQAAFTSLAKSRQLRDPVLEVGCGTGENALFLAGLGFDVTGVDIARTAIEVARQKGRLRQVRA